MKTPTIEAVFNRINRKNPTGKYSVHLRITLDRTSKYYRIPTPLMVTTDQWSGKEGKWINENHPYAFEINDKIKEIRNKIEEVVKRFYIHNKQVSFSDIFYQLRKKGDNMIFNDFVKEYIRLRPEKLEIATWEKYVTFLNHLNEFNPKIEESRLVDKIVGKQKKCNLENSNQNWH